jgi:hypothetical protein
MEVIKNTLILFIFMILVLIIIVPREVPKPQIKIIERVVEKVVYRTRKYKKPKRKHYQVTSDGWRIDKDGCLTPRCPDRASKMKKVEKPKDKVCK